MEETKTELQLIKLSEIQSQEVSWLWFPFIPYGKLTIVQGDSGDGKTTFILNIAVKLSKGESLDGGMNFTEPLNVIYQSAEDGFRWLGDYEITADEVLGGIGPKANKMEQAKRLLRELVGTNNAMQSNEIFSLADEQGTSPHGRSHATSAYRFYILYDWKQEKVWNKDIIKKALAELDFRGGTRSETERNQWAVAEKEQLAEIMLQHGIEWEKKGTHEKHFYDEDVKWRLAEPGALMSAKNYRDKKALPLVERLKEVVKNLTIKCVQLTEQSKKFAAKVDGQQIQISRLTDKVMEQSDTIDRLQEKVSDLRRLERHFGREQIQSIKWTVKGIRAGRKGK